jgi:hypothetical protein
VPRRVNVPAADDIFRPTAVPAPEPDVADAAEPEHQVVELAPAKKPKAAARQSSGRVKHDEKMTVYVTADELLDLEHARLDLRRHHGLGVDRGRLVRAAIAMALADLDTHGEDSALVQRLREA